MLRSLCMVVCFEASDGWKEVYWCLLINIDVSPCVYCWYGGHALMQCCSSVFNVVSDVRWRSLTACTVYFHVIVFCFCFLLQVKYFFFRIMIIALKVRLLLKVGWGDITSYSHKHHIESSLFCLSLFNRKTLIILQIENKTCTISYPLKMTGSSILWADIHTSFIIIAS